MDLNDIDLALSAIDRLRTALVEVRAYRRAKAPDHAGRSMETANHALDNVARAMGRDVKEMQHA